MTKVDNYLEKYLDGSISERELQQFRDLLDEEPQLRAELSQTLELRSVIHDDLLALTPPDHLSEFVRENLAGQFAALAAEEEEEEERRPFIFTSRFAGSSLAAMVALVLIALAPTLITPSGGDRVAELQGVRNEGLVQTFPTDGGSTEIDRAGADVVGLSIPTAPTARIPDNGDAAGRAATVSTEVQSAPATADPRTPPKSDKETTANPVVSDPILVAALDKKETQNIYVPKGEERTTAPDSRLGGDDNGGAVANVDAATSTPDNDADALAAATLPLGGTHLSNSLEFMANDPEDMLRDIVSTSRMLDRMETADRSLEERFGQTDMEASARSSRTGSSAPSLDRSESNRRRIMFGGTLASGLTTKESTFSVQGSAYLAMTLGEESRIGLEGGSAMFSYRKVVSVQTKPSAPQGFARRTTDPGELQGLADGGPSGDNFRAGGMGGSSGGIGTNNGGTANDQTLPGGGTGHSGDPVASREWKSPQILGGENSAYQPIGREGDPQYDYQSLEAEASMVYGLIFYDHTVTSLNKMLKINGRIGVGGADGGIVLNARAYAAISTHENVAWTLGIGGAMLHGFSDDINFNANYGVNAGVELGF